MPCIIPAGHFHLSPLFVWEIDKPVFQDTKSGIKPKNKSVSIPSIGYYKELKPPLC